MTRYLLDTNHLSPLATIGHPLSQQVIERKIAGDSFAIAVPCLTELLFGISHLRRAKETFREWERIEDAFDYYDIRREDAEAAGYMRVRLRQRGWQLDTIDALIATVALRYDLTLLTTDKDFRGIPGLKLDCWM